MLVIKCIHLHKFRFYASNRSKISASIQNKVHNFYVYSEDSNQSAHPHSLVRVLVFPPEETLDMRGARKFFSDEVQL